MLMLDDEVVGMLVVYSQVLVVVVVLSFVVHYLSSLLYLVLVMVDRVHIYPMKLVYSNLYL